MQIHLKEEDWKEACRVSKLMVYPLPFRLYKMVYPKGLYCVLFYLQFISIICAAV